MTSRINDNPQNFPTDYSLNLLPCFPATTDTNEHKTPEGSSAHRADRVSRETITQNCSSSGPQKENGKKEPSKIDLKKLVTYLEKNNDIHTRVVQFLGIVPEKIEVKEGEEIDLQFLKKCENEAKSENFIEFILKNSNDLITPSDLDTFLKAKDRLTNPEMMRIFNTLADAVSRLTDDERLYFKILPLADLIETESSDLVDWDDHIPNTHRKWPAISNHSFDSPNPYADRIEKVNLPDSLPDDDYPSDSESCFSSTDSLKESSSFHKNLQAILVINEIKNAILFDTNHPNSQKYWVIRSRNGLGPGIDEEATSNWYRMGLSQDFRRLYRIYPSDLILDIALKLDDLKVKKTVFSYLAADMAHLGNLDKALKIIHNLPDDEDGEKSLKSIALRRIAIAAYEKNGLEKAIEIGENIPDPNEKSFLYHQLALSEYEKGNGNKAIEMGNFLSDQKEKSSLYFELAKKALSKFQYDHAQFFLTLIEDKGIKNDSTGLMQFLEARLSKSNKSDSKK